MTHDGAGRRDVITEHDVVMCGAHGRCVPDGADTIIQPFVPSARSPGAMPAAAPAWLAAACYSREEYNKVVVANCLREESQTYGEDGRRARPHAPACSHAVGRCAADPVPPPRAR